MKKIVRKALKPLGGLPLRQINRSANMLSLHFGNLHDLSARGGEANWVYDWTLQIQCPWRISQGDRIVAAYRDFYFSDVPLKNVDVMNRSRFDSVLAHLRAEFDTTPPRVVSLEADDTGNFSINLSHDYCFEAFPAENMESAKSWRIFEPGPEGRSFVFPPSDPSS